jgi:hypothetical protein
MARCKIVILSIVSGLLILLSIISASADPDGTNETTPVENKTCENNTELMENVATLNINFITTMLQLLDLNLNLINETLNAHLEEYPFLKPTIEGTDEGIKGVDSILTVLGSSPENLNDTNVTPNSLNETLSQINSTLQYPDGMIEDANSTMGESNITTPMIGDMFKSIKTMTTLINQF